MNKPSRIGEDLDNSLMSTAIPAGAAAEEMLWLGHHPRLWAMLHHPLDRSGSLVSPDRVVVFCPPFAEEEKCSRRLYVELARALARRGIAALRFSFAGTCDSEGAFPDFTIESALNDIRRILDWSQHSLGASSLALFGLRLGGSLALQAVYPAAVNRIALWAPVVNGRSYVRMNFRRKSIRRMLNAADPNPTLSNRPQAGAQSSVLHASGDEPPTSPGEGQLPGHTADSDDLFDFDGYAVGRKLWDQIEALKGAPPPGWKGRALIVSVGPGARPAAESSALAEALRSSGAETSLECIVAQPFWNLLGLVQCPEIIRLTADWLARDFEENNH